MYLRLEDMDEVQGNSRNPAIDLPVWVVRCRARGLESTRAYANLERTTSSMADSEEDPVVTSGRREALLVLGVWIIATAWAVGVTANYGFDRDLQSIKFILGFPDWVFFAIVLPWWVCTVFAWWFGSQFMRDDHLGQEAPEDPNHGEGAA